MPQDESATSVASLHRVVMGDHMCPYGLKAKDLLESEGFEVDDHYLASRDEVDAFKSKYIFS